MTLSRQVVDHPSPVPVEDAPRQIDDLLNVRTPEKIAFEYELAGPVRRLSAWLIDLFVIQAGYCVVAGLVFLLSLFLAGGMAAWLGPEIAETFALMGLSLFMIGLFLVNWLYGAWMEARYNGQTVGKSWMNLRVLSHDGGAISSGQAIVRNLIRYADLMPLVPLSVFKIDPELELGGMEYWPVPTMMTGLIVMLVLPGFRRLGDLVAGTIVVSERTDFIPDLTGFDDPRVGQLAESLPGNFVPGRSLALALANYVDRRRRLGPERCAEIAAPLAGPLIEKMQLWPDTNHDLFLCSLYLRTFSAGDERGRKKKEARA